MGAGPRVRGPNPRRGLQRGGPGTRRVSAATAEPSKRQSAPLAAHPPGPRETVVGGPMVRGLLIRPAHQRTHVPPRACPAWQRHKDLPPSRLSDRRVIQTSVHARPVARGPQIRHADLRPPERDGSPRRARSSRASRARRRDQPSASESAVGGTRSDAGHASRSATTRTLLPDPFLVSRRKIPTSAGGHLPLPRRRSTLHAPRSPWDIRPSSGSEAGPGPPRGPDQRGPSAPHE